MCYSLADAVVSVANNEDDFQFVFLSVKVSFTRQVGNAKLLPPAATELERPHAVIPEDISTQRVWS